jgi:hypothetical protein
MLTMPTNSHITPVQTKITDFFARKTQTVTRPLQPQPHPSAPTQRTPTLPYKQRVRKFLLCYSQTYTTHPSILPFITNPSSYHLHTTWGHSSSSIDMSTVFRLILQNTNGLNLKSDALLTQQDLYTSRDFGAACLSLPETNTNWGIQQQLANFSSLLQKTWSSSSSSCSHSPEPFLSIYQPGGTATVLCNRWASRMIRKGSDPMNLGHWSYVILQGKGGLL